MLLFRMLAYFTT